MKAKLLALGALMLAAHAPGALCQKPPNGSELLQPTMEMLSNCRPVARAEFKRGKAYFVHSLETDACMKAFHFLQSVDACTPEGSNDFQLVAIFVEYAERNPQRWHEHAYDVALASLNAVWPCKWS